MAPALQQVQRRGWRGAAGLDHGLVFGRVLVGLEQDLVELLADGLRAAAQFGGPGVDLRLQQLFLLDGGQRLLQDFGRGLLEAALAGAAEVVRRLVQAEQRTGLLGQRGAGGEIVARQVGKAELFLGREFPGQVQLDAAAWPGPGRSARPGRAFELEQDVGGLDLDPLAGVQLDLGRGSASDRMRPARNLPASSNSACMGAIVPWACRREGSGQFEEVQMASRCVSKSLSAWSPPSSRRNRPGGSATISRQSSTSSPLAMMASSPGRGWPRISSARSSHVLRAGRKRSSGWCQAVCSPM
jgi:hypothetical protein